MHEAHANNTLNALTQALYRRQQPAQRATRASGLSLSQRGRRHLQPAPTRRCRYSTSGMQAEHFLTLLSSHCFLTAQSNTSAALFNAGAKTRLPKEAALPTLEQHLFEHDLFTLLLRPEQLK